MPVLLSLVSWAVITYGLYTIYQIFLHPLAKFSTCFPAPLTNLWKVYHVWRGDLEIIVLALHKKHGKFVRIGPNHLDVSDATAVKTIYGAGRAFPKSEYYDAFTAIRPNLFGTRDEEIHSARRRTVANSFSAQSIAKMEQYVDGCMEIMFNRFDRAVDANEPIDLKQWISFFVADVLGELAFSESFGLLDHGNEREMPMIREHVLLGTLSGQVPWLIPYINKVVPWLPFTKLKRMVKGRAELRQRAINAVNHRIEYPKDRMDLLGRLLDELETGIDSKGRDFDMIDVQTEAFGFIIAGSHTTATSITFLIWYLLHNRDKLQKLKDEVDTTITSDLTAQLPFSNLSNLPYLQATVSEGFRINPVFSMPIVRVVPEGGCEIADEHIPGGTDVSVVAHALHHNESVFGPNLEQFWPERWLDAEYARDANPNLIPFGAGHRACIGRNIAYMEILKLIASLIARYDISLVETPSSLETGQSTSMPATESFGLVELKGPLVVELRHRETSSIK